MANRSQGLNKLTKEKAKWLQREWKADPIGTPVLYTRDGFRLYISPWTEPGDNIPSGWYGAVTDERSGVGLKIRPWQPTQMEAKLALFDLMQELKLDRRLAKQRAA